MDLSEITTLQEAMTKAFEDYKQTNDERLGKLATDSEASTSDLDAKIAKIDEDMKEIGDAAKEAFKKANRMETLGGGGEKADQAKVELKSFNDNLKANARRIGTAEPADLDAEGYEQYKAAFRKFLRKGDNKLDEVERKALNVGTDSEGGYLVDFEMDSAIDRVASDQSAIRGLARTVTIGSGSWKKITKTGGAGAGGWGTETTAPTETTTPTWIELEYTPGTVWAEPRATSQSLEDAIIDLEADLREEIGLTIADQESQAFVDGNGTNKPKGMLAYTPIANATFLGNTGHTNFLAGNIGFVASGAAANFAASNPSDQLLNLVHSLKRGYRSNAAMVMNDATLAAIRKFKDGNGIYLWNPTGLLQGASGQLLGYRVVTDDYMPDIAADAYPIAFGDFRRAYAIVDRRGTTILRDPYTAKPYVKFYATRRTGGGMMNFEALKLFKISA